MRRISVLCLAVAAALAFSACGRGNGAGKTGVPSPGADSGGDSAGAAVSDSPSVAEENGKMKISVTDGSHTVVFELNGSAAAKSLYNQLPLTVDVENYSDNEKIFYPGELDTSGAVNADAKKGTLAYFSPWGDVVMYYGDFGSYSGLYELGQAVSGADEIEHLSGKISITAAG